MNMPLKPVLWLTLLITMTITVMANAPASSDCPSGYFCAWSGSSYTGTMRKLDTPDKYHRLNLPSVKSYYNRYEKRVWLHATSDGSGTYSCLASGAKSANVTGWQAAAKAVWLSTTTGC